MKASRCVSLFPVPAQEICISCPVIKEKSDVIHGMDHGSYGHINYIEGRHTLCCVFYMVPHKHMLNNVSMSGILI